MKFRRIISSLFVAARAPFAALNVAVAGPKRVELGEALGKLVEIGTDDLIRGD